MATSAVAHDADPAPRKGPKAQQKWLTASVRNDAVQVIAAAFDQAETRDPQHHRYWWSWSTAPPTSWN
jgi:hypothetical protein